MSGASLPLPTPVWLCELPSCMRLYTCPHMHAHVYTAAHTHGSCTLTTPHTHAHVYTNAHTHAHRSVHTPYTTSTCVCTWVWAHYTTHTCTCVHRYTHVHKGLCTLTSHMHAHVYTMLTWVCAHSLHHTSYTPVHRYIHTSIHKGTCNCPHALYTQTAHPHTSTHTHAHHTCAQRHAHDVCTIYAHTSA